jgi:hypothetical protein
MLFGLLGSSNSFMLLPGSRRVDRRALGVIFLRFPGGKTVIFRFA